MSADLCVSLRKRAGVFGCFNRRFSVVMKL